MYRYTYEEAIREAETRAAKWGGWWEVVAAPDGRVVSSPGPEGAEVLEQLYAVGGQGCVRGTPVARVWVSMFGPTTWHYMQEA